MPKFLITFMASGGIAIEAETEEQAKEKFNNYPDNLLLDELDANGIEMTDIFEDDSEQEDDEEPEDFDPFEASQNMPCDNTGYCSPACRKFGSGCEH
jgi:hypothetical protein